MLKILSNPLIAILLLIVFLAFGFLVLSLVGQSSMDRVEWVEEVYRVQSGDSLWEISGKYCPDNVDRREWIDEVQARNGLTSSFIYAGQRLYVFAPAKGV